MQEDPTLTPAPSVEFCYRHPKVETRVHCTRCERPICPDCMIPAPVGYQCPECVAEARREFNQGPGRRTAAARGAARGLSVTRVLLVAILAGFFLELAVGGANALMQGPSEQQLFDLGALSPLMVAHGQYWRLFTAMFLHAGLLHIAFNAYALYLFGTMVEDTFGRARYLMIFFVTGFLASATSYTLGPVEGIGVGASGAIFGVFGAFIAYNYRRRHLAAAAANLRWAMTLILLNAFLAVGFRTIDWHAHVGGLVAGVAAGFIVEGWGPAGQRKAIRVAGFAVLIGLGAALVLWRTSQIQALPIYRYFFGV
jgi:membrane associated rhomboid family serine protease